VAAQVVAQLLVLALVLVLVRALVQVAPVQVNASVAVQRQAAPGEQLLLEQVLPVAQALARVALRDLPSVVLAVLVMVVLVAAVVAVVAGDLATQSSLHA